MLLIVAHHYVVNSGLNDVIFSNPTSENSIFYLLMGAWGKTGINCFVLITGYFMCKSQITLRKFLKLLMWILTYSVLITAAFTVAGYRPFGLMKMWLGIIPMRNVQTNFGSCFLLFYLAIPFLNILINNISKRQHQLLLLLAGFIYVLHGSVPKMQVAMNYVSWFSVLYLISSYLRLHPLKRDGDTKFWGYMTLISWTLSAISVVAIPILTTRFGIMTDLGRCYFFVSDSNAILAVTNGVTSFMFFKNLKIRNSKIINIIAASSFGVLLIHANSDTMRQWLWCDVVDCSGHYSAPHYWLYAIGCVLIIYVACTIIDIIRKKTIETPILNFAERVCLGCQHKFLRILAK